MGRILPRPDTPFSSHSLSCPAHVRQIPPLPGTHLYSDTQRAVCSHTDTCTQATNMCAADACTNLHTKHALSPTPNPFTETHTHTKKSALPSTANPCEPQQAQTVLIQSAITTVALGEDLNVFGPDLFRVSSYH